MKRIILTESQLCRVIKESVKKIIKEKNDVITDKEYEKMNDWKEHDDDNRRMNGPLNGSRGDKRIQMDWDYDQYDPYHNIYRKESTPGKISMDAQNLGRLKSDESERYLSRGITDTGRKTIDNLSKKFPNEYILHKYDFEDKHIRG